MEADNEMPAWLDKDFVQTLLRENENDNSIVVQKVTVRPAVGKGENYASQLHRVAVDFTTGTGVKPRCFCTKKGTKSGHRSLIVKSLPVAEFMAKMLVESGIFNREIRLYQETLSALYMLMLGSRDAVVETLSAQAYWTTRPYTLVLEDLCSSGYKMAERHRGLGLRHTKLALRVMARLHALSVALEAKEPGSISQYVETIYTEEMKPKNQQFTEPGINLLGGVVETWPGYERFGKKIVNINWVDLITDLVAVKQDGVTVLNHGDGWTNNMLFKYNESGDVESVKFVDFQISRYASPALDLQYFMHTSPNDVVRSQHWDEVIAEYYKAFVDVLKSLDCESKAFTFEQLKEEIQRTMIFGLLTAAVILPIVLADLKDAPNLSNMDENTPEENMKKADYEKTYNADRFRAVFEQILLRYENLGII